MILIVANGDLGVLCVVKSAEHFLDRAGVQPPGRMTAAHVRTYSRMDVCEYLVRAALALIPAAVSKVKFATRVPTN